MTDNTTPTDGHDEQGPGAGERLPRRTPGRFLHPWPFADHTTCADVPTNPRVDVTYEQFTEDHDGASTSPRMWDAWSWWLRSERDPDEGTVLGDRLTLARYAGPPFVQNMAPEQFTMLTSSGAGGVNLADMFGYQPGIGDAVTFSRDELVRFGRWIVETFDAPSTAPYRHGGVVGEGDNPQGVTARLARAEAFEAARRQAREAASAPPADDQATPPRTPREVLAALDTGNDDPARIGPAGLAAVAQILADMGGDTLEPWHTAMTRTALWAYEGDVFDKRAVTGALAAVELEARAQVIRNSARLREYGAQVTEPTNGDDGKDDDG